MKKKRERYVTFNGTKYMFFYSEKCDKENTERDITQATNSCFTPGEMQDQSVWGNCSSDELIRSKYS